jgi:hypothetical protein
MIDYNIIVSHSGTRHIVGIPRGLQGVQSLAFRVTTICGFGVRSEDSLLALYTGVIGLKPVIAATKFMAAQSRIKE